MFSFLINNIKYMQNNRYIGCCYLLKMSFLAVVKKQRDIHIITLGKKVKELRNQRGLTQLQLSIDSGVPLSQISAIEGGRINTTVLTLVKISSTLNVKLKELFDFE
jgi:DNA-binding XRE family transcriptional regulator